MDIKDAKEYAKGMLNDNPCNCTETLVKKMNKNRVVCEGIMIVTDPSGEKRVGLHTVWQAVGQGAKPTTGLIQFNFCPFCGIQLLKLEDIDAPPINN